MLIFFIYIENFPQYTFPTVKHKPPTGRRSSVCLDSSVIKTYREENIPMSLDSSFISTVYFILIRTFRQGTSCTIKTSHSYEDLLRTSRWPTYRGSSREECYQGHRRLERLPSAHRLRGAGWVRPGGTGHRSGVSPGISAQVSQSTTGVRRWGMWRRLPWPGRQVASGHRN